MSELKTLTNYKFDSSVEAFLQEFPFLKQVLEEGYPQMMSLFGAETEIVLKVVIDSEIPDWRTLFAYIWTELDVDEALNRLDQLDDNWYIKLPYSVRSIFSMNVKCK